MDVVRFGNIDPNNQSRTTIVTGVIAGSPAEKAGLKATDEILSIHGKAISTATQIPTIAAPLPEGTIIPIKSRRAGKEQTLQVKLGNSALVAGQFQQINQKAVLANNFLIQGKALEAIPLTEELLKLSPKIWGELSEDRIRLEISLGLLYSTQMNEQQCQIHQQEALVLAKKLYGEGTNVYRDFKKQVDIQNVALAVRQAKEHDYGVPVPMEEFEDLSKHIDAFRIDSNEELFLGKVDWILDVQDSDYCSQALRMKKVLS